MAAEPFAFDTGQLRAVIGHAMQRPEIWERYDSIGIASDWFRTDPTLAELWSHVAAFRTKNGTPAAIDDPEVNELVSFVNSSFGPDTAQATPARIKLCLDAAKRHRIDVLAKKLDGWARFNLAAQTALKIKEKYDLGEHEGIESLIIAAATDVQKLDAGFGKHAADRFKLSVDRVRDEAAGRALLWDQRLSWGVPLLDDATDGIFKHDFWLLGATSGTGKTQQAAMIAASNSGVGRKVAAFFLEATEIEIERRIKFGMVMRQWREDHRDSPAEPPRWRRWMHGEPETMRVCAPYEEKIRREFDALMSNMQTYYKTTKRFGKEELRQEILRIYADVDLIVVDHFHFIDVNESRQTNENQEATELAAEMRQTTLSLGTPIVCVVHLNQEADGVLVPNLKHIHGTTNIHKMSTGVILLAKASGMTSADARCRGLPTFFRIAKGRTEQVFQTAVCFWDPDTGVYLPDYGLGKMNFASTKWTETTTIPWWVNKDRLVRGLKLED